MYEEIQVAMVIDGAIRTLEVIVNVSVEGSAQTLGVAEVLARCSERHAHSPITHVCSHKRPRHKHHLCESHIRTILGMKCSLVHDKHNLSSSSECSENKWVQSSRVSAHHV